jgi:PAS domain S-box-containing protein
MANVDRASVVVQRVKTWVAKDGGRSIITWFVTPLLIIAICLLVLAAEPEGAGPHLAYVTLYPAVIVASLIGGYRAGLVATVFSICGVALLDPWRSAPDVLQMAAFGADSLLIVAVCQAMIVAMRRVAEARAQTRHAFQLLEGEQLFRSFVEHAPAALAMFDREMRYIGASRRWMNDFGIDPTSMKGRRQAEDLATMPKAWSRVCPRALAGEVCRKEEDLVVHADGRRQWLRWEVRPWNDIAGSVAGIVVFCEDITAQKQAASDAAGS